MRLQLFLIAAMAWAPAFAQFDNYCTLCKGGVGLTKPDGIVTTSDGLTATCVALLSHVSTLSPEACASLQLDAAEPCGCLGSEPEPEEEPVPVVTEAVEESEDFIDASGIAPVQTTAAEDTFVCEICVGGEITKPAAYTLNELGVPTSCQELHDSRGSIPEVDCGRVQSFAAAPCGCTEVVTPLTPPVVDTSTEEVPEAFTCNICGDGVIGNMEGLVLNSRGVGRTCAQLDAAKASIPSTVCPQLQSSALEPCECQFDGPVPAAVVPSIPSSESSEIQGFAKCSICGEGEMAIPEGIVTTPNGHSARCDALDANPKQISVEACSNIQALAKMPCGCIIPYEQGSATSDTDILSDITPFECSICGDGEVTNPNGIVLTPLGQAATCSALEANSKTVPESSCADIQALSKEPCGCSSGESLPGSEEWVGQQGQQDPGICHICGGAAQQVGNAAKMVTTPTGMFTCYSLHSAGLAGAIAPEDCAAVQAEAQEQCGCFVDGPTEAPTDVYNCPVCEEGLYVTRYDAILNPETGMTCAQYLEEAKMGRINSEQCSIIQEMSGAACGCSPPPTFPTEAPTMFECQLCGPGREMTALDNLAMLPSYQKMPCSTLQQRAESGAIHSTQCARYQPIAEEYCGCRNKWEEEHPEPEHYECDLCGNGLKVTNPNAVVPLPTLEDRTCIDLMTDAMNGKITRDTCALLQPFTRGPCGCANGYETDAIPAEGEEGDCFSNLGEIQALERSVTDTSITRMYTLCPVTTFDLGVWGEEGEIVDGQPFIALRPNVLYQCGHDGDRGNNCILKGGDFGLASYDGVYDGLHEVVSGVEIKGLTFESQNLFSVILKSAGDITFTGCKFTKNSNNVPVLMQWEEQESIAENRRLVHEGDAKQVVTFQDCVFRDNFVDDSLSFPGIIENTFNSELVVKNCLFQDNVYGSNDNLADTGYAIRSFGHLTLESTCFIDNTFLNNGPVLVYGAQFAAYDNYVESTQTDLACELGALFSSQDDMGETIPTCVSSDASTCSFTQGPTPSPTYSYLDEDWTEAEADSSATSIGLTLLPMVLALSIPLFGL